MATILKLSYELLNTKKEQQSKKPMPKEFKKIKKYKDPFYWAAFILLDAID